jgi:hypothetical protein
LGTRKEEDAEQEEINAEEAQAELFIYCLF